MKDQEGVRGFAPHPFLETLPLPEKIGEEKAALKDRFSLPYPPFPSPLPSQGSGVRGEGSGARCLGGVIPDCTVPYTTNRDPTHERGKGVGEAAVLCRIARRWNVPPHSRDSLHVCCHDAILALADPTTFELEDL